MMNEEENIESGSQNGKTESHEEVSAESMSRQMRKAIVNEINRSKNIFKINLSINQKNIS